MSASASTPSTLPATDRLVQLELLALYAFAFVLPLFEAPKNLLWIVYLALWVVNRRRSRDYGGPWDGWDTLILLWISSGYASAVFAGIHHKEWLSTFDILRYASVLWLLRRSGYTEETLGRLLVAVVAGTLAGLAWGYYEVRVTGDHQFLGLNSVGHVNHSAIYVAIAFGATIAWLPAAWTHRRTTQCLLGLLVCLVFGLSLIAMESRATVGAGFMVGVLIVGGYAVRSGRSVWKVLVGVLLVATAVFAAQPEVVRKNSLRLHQHLFLAHRDTIWRAGIIAWRQYPMFGVGMSNYGRIDLDRLEKWSRAQGRKLDRSQVLTQSHAHSLYVNTLTERGVLGLAALLAVLAAWGWALVRHVPERNDSILRWSYWGGAFSAWLVTVLVGAVNTTLHHEHALISMILLGGWFALLRGERVRRLASAPRA